MTTLLVVSPTGLTSGAETVLLRVIEAARRSGMEVYCLSPVGPLAERLARAGIQSLAIPELKIGSGPAVGAFTRLAGCMLQAAARIRRYSRDADLVLVNGILALPALRLARVRVPTAWLVHDVVHRRSWRGLIRVTKPAVRQAIAVSDAVAAPLRAAGLEVVVVRNGTPWPVEGRSSESDDPPVVGCAGMLTPWKGQDVLLDALARIEDPRVTLELAGGRFPKDGPYEQRLRDRAVQPDLNGRVRFLGHVPAPLERMRTWSVLVSASVDPEAAPLNVLEAMSVGVPVVGTAHGGTPEVLGQAGLLVPPRDVPAMATAITRLLEDRELWLRCHRAGPAQVSQACTLEDQNRIMVATLEHLANSSLAAG